MRVLIYEHICGGGLDGQPLPAELANAGAGMLQAVTQDFVDAGCEVTTTLDPRLKLKFPGCNVVPITSDNIESEIESLAKESQATLIIAPESGGTLHRWARLLVQWNVNSIGSSPAAIAICSDKMLTFQHLSERGIRTPKTVAGHLQTAGSDMSSHAFLHGGSLIVKPRDGVGCEQTFMIGNANTLPSLLKNSLPRDFITQPWIEGRPVSVSFIVTSSRIHPLLVGDQHIAGSPTLRYEGGTIPTRSPEVEAVINVARQAIETIDGLHGFVGVDLVVEESTGKPWVIDINPRLTVSYCALRSLSLVNLANSMLRQPQMQQVVPDRWHAGSATFDASGHIMEAMV